MCIRDRKCNWSTNIDRLVRLTSKRFYALQLLRASLDKRQLKIVYSSLVLSVFDYCAPLFVGLPCCESDRLDRVQRRFNRFCIRFSIRCFRDCTSDCLISLRKRRETMTLSFFQKVASPQHILHKFLPIKSSSGRYILPFRNTRCNSFFSLLPNCSIAFSNVEFPFA